MKIKTDNKWKHFKFRYEVPKKILKNQFDYQDEDETIDGFICYMGYWYHLDMFERIPQPSPFASAWEGYHCDTFFSGILIQVSPDCESYRVATFIS